MPATIPPRPAAGALIDADWGGDVHDRIYTPSGIVVSGPATTVTVGASMPLALTNLVAGDPDWISGDGTSLVCPAGKSGWYDIIAHVSVGAGAQQGHPCRISVHRDGAFFAGQTGAYIAEGATTYLSMMTWLQMNDGQRVQVNGYIPVLQAFLEAIGMAVGDTQFTATRVSVRRSSNTIANSLFGVDDMPDYGV